jgi:hypothetical protein
VCFLSRPTTKGAHDKGHIAEFCTVKSLCRALYSDTQCKPSLSCTTGDARQTKATDDAPQWRRRPTSLSCAEVETHDKQKKRKKTRAGPAAGWRPPPLPSPPAGHWLPPSTTTGRRQAPQAPPGTTTTTAAAAKHYHHHHQARGPSTTPPLSSRFGQGERWGGGPPTGSGLCEVVAPWSGSGGCRAGLGTPSGLHRCRILRRAWGGGRHCAVGWRGWSPRWI